MKRNCADSIYFRNFERLLRLSYEKPSVKRPPPDWLLGFHTRGCSVGEDFLKTVCLYLLKIHRSPHKTRVDFHSESGVFTKCLYDYLKDVPSVDKTVEFFSDCREYMRAERLVFPEYAGGDLAAYTRLKNLEGGTYTHRLIDEYVGGGGGSLLKTQDFVVLYKMSLLSFVESVICALTLDDMVQAVEEHRC